MKSSTTNPWGYRSSRPYAPFLVLIAGLLFTFAVSYHLFRVAEAEDQARFRALVQEVHASIASRLETYTALLRAGTGLFAASETVEAREFRSFTRGLGLQQHYPGVQGIGFSIRVSPEQKVALVEQQKQAGSVNFHIWPDSQRSEYHSIIYLEPLDQRNQAAIGYDMFTDASRRAAMERARDTGLPAASGLVTLVQEIDPQTKQAGFLIYAPVYRKDQKISTESERRQALVGFVYGPFRADDFLQGIVAQDTYDNIEFQVYDGPESKPDNLLHRSTKPDDLTPANYKPRFVATTSLDVAGRPWTITYASTPGFSLSYGNTWISYMLVIGAFLSLLFFAVTRSQLKARVAAERAAAELRESDTNLRETLTERGRAEDALRESEERYRELVENANDIVFTLDLAGTMTSVNRAVELVTGYSRDELIGMNMSEFLTSESTEVARHMTERKLSGEERTNYEVDVRTKDGRALTLEISSRLLLARGKVVGVQGVARDITNRRRAEETLRQADQRALSEYERLLERISSLAQALGTARELVTIFRALREFSVVSVPCDGLFISLYDADRDVRTACYAWGDGHELNTSGLPPMPVNTSGPNSRAVRTGQVIITDDYMNAARGHPVVILGPDNGLRPECSLVIPMAVMGRIVGTIEVQSYQRTAYREEHVTAMRMAANLAAVAIQNVQLLERESNARAAAEESNRLKDEFLATVSHELRTPLTAILGWSRMLEAGAINDPMASRALETIRRNAKAQSQIIDDILDVSRIITGKLYLDLHPIDLAPIVEAAVNVVRPTAEAKGVLIETELDSQPTVVTGDSSRLQQVIWNLLSNAIKFTPSGGRVHLGVNDIGSQVEIRVTDTGQGISREFLPFVFDRFRQADSTSTRRHGGIGLGLAIARHLVEIHGGTIKAESAGEGKGATFSVRLPSVGSIASLNKHPAGSGEAQDSFEFDSRLEGVHVLLVDDDLDTLDLLSAALRQQKAKVTAVASAAEALAAINASKPDIVVSDIAMPDENGYQLLEKIRAMNFDAAQIPALAITAYAKEEDREAALSSGYQGFLAKPIELSDLVTAVAEVLRRD
ncbi:MAG: CHASE domain-containing protein [Pyrinomonadaceae bacterium]